MRPQSLPEILSRPSLPGSVTEGNEAWKSLAIPGENWAWFSWGRQGKRGSRGFLGICSHSAGLSLQYRGWAGRLGLSSPAVPFSYTPSQLGCLGSAEWGT